MEKQQNQEIQKKKETPQAELARLREELRVTKAALYEEVVSLASEQYGIELLKNFGPKQ